MSKVILAVGAHPDDIEIGVGGTLKKFKGHGEKLYSIIMTRGENGNHCPEMSEAEASASMLGLEDLVFLDFKDTFIPYNGKSVQKLEEYIKKINPSIIYTHTSHDRHQDHQNTSKIIQSASRFIPNVFLFDSPSTSNEFAPNYFEDITQTIDQKIEMLGKYHSQVEKGIVDLDLIKAQARVWGRKNRQINEEVNFAEAFEVYRTFVM